MNTGRYLLTLHGEEPSNMKHFRDKADKKEKLEACIDICSSMHLVMSTNQPTHHIPNEMNPADLSCTCKGFRMRGNCSHVIAVTAVHIPHCYGVSELQALTRQLGNVKRASHRPKAVRPGNQMQPHDDEEELPELQYEDENLMEMPAIC